MGFDAADVANSRRILEERSPGEDLRKSVEHVSRHARFNPGSPLEKAEATPSAKVAAEAARQALDEAFDLITAAYGKSETLDQNIEAIRLTLDGLDDGAQKQAVAGGTLRKSAARWSDLAKDLAIADAALARIERALPLSKSIPASMARSVVKGMG